MNIEKLCANYTTPDLWLYYSDSYCNYDNCVTYGNCALTIMQSPTQNCFPCPCQVVTSPIVVTQEPGHGTPPAMGQHSSKTLHLILTACLWKHLLRIYFSTLDIDIASLYSMKITQNRIWIALTEHHKAYAYCLQDKLLQPTSWKECQPMISSSLDKHHAFCMLTCFHVAVIMASKC